MRKGEKSPSTMSLIEFIEHFGTEEQCRAHLFAMRFGSGFVCPRCGHMHGVEIKTRLSMQCSNCGYQQSATVGTVMHDTKLPIQKWYYAIYLITSGKRGMSAKELQRHIKVTYKTAWYINQRIRSAMASADDKYKLDGVVTVDEAFFTGREENGAVPKRGRGTSKTKVIVAVSLNEAGHPQYAKMRVVENFKAKTVEQFMYANVAPNSVITTDGFSSYRSQNLKKDYFHDFANFNKNHKDSNVKWLHILISNAKAFILGTFHGLDRNNLQAYLNEFCYRFNRRKIPYLMFEKLQNSMFVTVPIGYYCTGVMG
jgi:transposase-like protein